MKISRTKIVLIIILMLLVAGLFQFSSYIKYYVIKKQIISSIEKLQSDSLKIKYDTLYASAGKLVIKNLDILKTSKNDTCANGTTHAHINSIEITEISIIPILLNHNLKIDSVILHQPHIEYADVRQKKNNKKGKLASVSIGYLNIIEGKIAVRDSASCKKSNTLYVNMDVTNLQVENLNKDSAQWSVKEAKVWEVKIEIPDKFYTVKIKQANYSASKKSFNLDSLQVIPDYGKTEFMQKSKIQTDRIFCVIPKLNATGIGFITTDNPMLHIQYINLSMWTEVFRDKRYPFKNKLKLLPVRFVKSIGLPFQIDSLKISDSFMAYEEFQEEGSTAGKVFFTNLNSSIYNISNRTKDEARMEATARFMDSGLLHGKFTFPSDPSKTYTAEGTLTNFALKEVNPMLTAVARAEIKSGTLEELKFAFSYNDTRSDGRVELNYKDLVITSLKKDKKEKNKFLTFILGILVKKDMQEKTATAKTTGEILFNRDKNKSLFNYWWKSILSGVKSVYNPLSVKR